MAHPPPDRDGRLHAAADVQKRLIEYFCAAAVFDDAEDLLAHVAASPIVTLR